MSVATELPPRHMTIPEFLAWAEAQPDLWQLRDGEPEMMAPAADRHGRIQAVLAGSIYGHLSNAGSSCSVVIAPGVIPRVWSDRNMLIPDIGITCAPATGAVAMPDPVTLIEILSPSNEAQTRANVWAFATIPTVAEIILVSSFEIAAEILRRGPDGNWPKQPEFVGTEGVLRIDSIGFEMKLREAFRTAGVGTELA